MNGVANNGCDGEEIFPPVIEVLSHRYHRGGGVV